MHILVEDYPYRTGWLQGYIINDQHEKYNFDAHVSQYPSSDGISTAHYPDGDNILELNITDEINQNTILSYKNNSKYWMTSENRDSIDATINALIINLEDRI